MIDYELFKIVAELERRKQLVPITPIDKAAEAAQVRAAAIAAAKRAEFRGHVAEAKALAWKWIIAPILWLFAFFIVALVSGPWSLLVPVLWIGTAISNADEKEKAAEAKRISEIACPRARHEAELLSAVKAIHARQW